MPIKTIEYTAPTSWDDKEMDWDNPEFGYDYIYALTTALRERVSVLSIVDLSKINERLLSSIYDFYDIRNIGLVIKDICGGFINWEETSNKNRELPTNYITSLHKSSSYDPITYTRNYTCNIFWTWNDLCKKIPDLALVPPPSALQIECKKYMIACKKAIDKLTVVPAYSRKGQPIISFTKEKNTGTGRSGKNGMDYAINQATDVMKDGKNIVVSSSNLLNEMFINCASEGLFFFNRPAEQEDPYYEIYCMSEIIKFTQVTNNILFGRTPLLKLIAITTFANRKMIQNITWTAPEPDEYIFSNNSIPFSMGLGVVEMGKIEESPQLLEYKIGDDSSLKQLQPLNFPQISGNFNVTGCQVTFYPYIDFGVEGAFQFFTPSQS